MIRVDFQDVVYAVKEIEATASDNELAHRLEDMMYERLLYAIATGECANVRLCAETALESKKIKFARVCS